jgi:hypothetical protein
MTAGPPPPKSRWLTSNGGTKHSSRNAALIQRLFDEGTLLFVVVRKRNVK